MVNTKHVKFALEAGKPVLEVALSEQQFRMLPGLMRMGDKPKDNVSTLRDLMDCFPDIFPEGLPRSLVRQSRILKEHLSVKKIPENLQFVGQSLWNLFHIAGGTSSSTLARVGSHVGVLVKDLHGNPLIRGEPATPQPLEEIRQQVARIKKGVVRDYRRGGQEKIDDGLQRADEALRTYETMFSLKQMGFDDGEIGRRINLSRHGVGSLLAGKRQSRHIFNLDPDVRMQRGTMIEAPREKSVPFAHILGVYAAVTESDSSKPNLEFAHRDEKVIDRIRAEFKGVFHEDASKREHFVGPRNTKYRHKYYIVEFQPLALGSYLREMTDGNTRIPWEHLVDADERKAFLQGFLEFAGNVSLLSGKPRFQIQKTDNPGLIKDLAVLFKGFGVLPTLKLEGKPSLFLQDRHEFANLSACVTLPKAKQERIDLYKKFEYQRASYTVLDYTSVMKYTSEHPEAKPEDISRALSRKVKVPESVIEYWIKRGLKPDSVQRLENIEAIGAQLPDPDVVGLLCRKYGYTGERARAVALKVRIGDLRETIEFLESKDHLKVDLVKNPELLQFKVDEMGGFQFEEFLVSKFGRNGSIYAHALREKLEDRRKQKRKRRKGSDEKTARWSYPTVNDDSRQMEREVQDMMSGR